MKPTSIKILTLLLFFVFIACNEINPEEPEDAAFESEGFRKPSLIAAPIAIEISDLNKTINNKLKKDFYQDNSFEEDGVKLTVSRFENITVRLNGDMLDYMIPLKVNVSAKKMGITLGGKDGIEMMARVKLQSKIQITPLWHLKSSTTFKSIEWVKKPSTKIIGIKINLDKIIEKLLEDKAKEIETKIDEIAYHKVDLKKVLLKTWLDIQKPILINKKFKKVWLRANPEKIFAAQPYGKNEMLFIGIKIQANIETLIGDSPDYSLVNNMPNLIIQDKIDEGFALHLQSKIFFGEVNEALKENIKNIKVPIEGHEVLIKSMEISGKGNKLVVKIEVDGDSKGVLYLTGKPKLDTLNATLSIENFNFDVHTEEVLLHSASWLVNAAFKDFILEKLTFKLNPHFEKIPDLVLQALSKSKVAQKVELDFKAFKIIPEKVQVTAEGLSVKVSSYGKISLELLKLE